MQAHGGKVNNPKNGMEVPTALLASCCHGNVSNIFKVDSAKLMHTKNRAPNILGGK